MNGSSEGLLQDAVAYHKYLQTASFRQKIARKCFVFLGLSNNIPSILSVFFDGETDMLCDRQDFQ
ncbi:hypothetical protein [Acetobacter persici]|uniref:hypothetical protein n=1 Tax=Acetobacter persici TaxID=1076596 RepID=UPI001F423935|nr:hypothetical protein [Acetobacter persici]MCG0998698.1 hypothetical protein [Acetobacter persici]